jgi:hypothetical protein
MRKILIACLSMFIVLTSAYGQNIQEKNKTEKIKELIKDVNSLNLIYSSNGRWIVFVKKSNYTVPDSCFYAFEKGDRTDEIWIVDIAKATKKPLVVPSFNCKDVSKTILDPHNLQFSPDNKTLYFETSAWVTSGAVHAVDVNGKHLRFITDGSELQVVQSGLYKGDLIVNQHRYRFNGDIPLGSYNWDWLFTPKGKQVKLYKKDD